MSHAPPRPRGRWTQIQDVKNSHLLSTQRLNQVWAAEGTVSAPGAHSLGGDTWLILGRAAAVPSSLWLYLPIFVQPHGL